MRRLMGLLALALAVAACSAAPAPNVTIVDQRPQGPGTTPPVDSTPGPDASSNDASSSEDADSDAATPEDPACKLTHTTASACVMSATTQTCALPCGDSGNLFTCNDNGSASAGGIAGSKCSVLNDAQGLYRGTCCVDACARLDPPGQTGNDHNLCAQVAGSHAYTCTTGADVTHGCVKSPTQDQPPVPTYWCCP
jgi:hypothetical protein